MTISIDEIFFTKHKKAERTKGYYLTTICENFSVKHPQTGEMIGPAAREFIVSRNSASVLPYCQKEKKVLMARQFRMPVMYDRADTEQAWIYEIVAGVIEDGHLPLDTAVREALEEVGIILDPDRLELVANVYPSPGILTEQMFIYTCEVDECLPEHPSGGLEAEHEAIIAQWVSYEDMAKIKADGDIRDSKTFIALNSIGI